MSLVRNHSPVHHLTDKLSFKCQVHPPLFTTLSVHAAQFHCCPFPLSDPLWFHMPAIAQPHLLYLSSSADKQTLQPGLVRFLYHCISFYSWPESQCPGYLLSTTLKSGHRGTHSTSLLSDTFRDFVPFRLNNEADLFSAMLFPQYNMLSLSSDWIGE